MATRISQGCTSSIATQASDNVSITGGAISNVTFSDVTLDGGTY